MFSVLIFALFASAVLFLYLTARPWNFPRNVPAVPLWLQVRAKLMGVSRVAFYNKYVRPLAEKHGAVAIWQEDRWVILVSRPEYVVQVLKNANLELEKYATFVRNPHSNGGYLFGMNVIDANGRLHDEFVDIVKPAIVQRVSISSMRAESASLAARLIGLQKAAGDAGISLDSTLWRWSVTIFADYFMDVKEWPLSYQETSAQQITVSMGSHPIWDLQHMFIFLRRWTWLSASYKKATALIQQLEDTLVAVTESRTTAISAVSSSAKLAQRLACAHEQGLLSSFHYRSNLKQLLVAGHENAEVALQSAMYELARNPGIQHLLHQEVATGGFLGDDYTIEELDQLPLLAAVVYETLRLYPPLGTMLNRRTVKPMQLGPDVLLPADTMVGWSAYAVQTDPQIWGETAGQFDPWRWGRDIESIKRMARSSQSRGRFVPFSLHARRCLGSAFALTQLKVGLCELLRSIEWRQTRQSERAFNEGFLIGVHNCKFNIHQQGLGKTPGMGTLRNKVNSVLSSS